MTDIVLAVDVKPELADKVEEPFLQRVVGLALREAGVSEPVELSLVITDDEELRELNRTYRGLDEPTDVLSFPMVETGEHLPSEQAAPRVEFVQPPDGLRHLGDVIISYPRALAQAAQAGHAVRQELALLTAHGVLHLLGYDHAEPDEEAVMRRAQENVVARALQGD